MAYKQAVDNNNRSGAAPSVAPFLDLLDNIYGSENMPPEQSSIATSNAGIARIDTGDNFDDTIEICPPTPPETSTSSSVDNLPPAPKRSRLSTRDKNAQLKLDFMEKRLETIEANKFKRFAEKEAAKERRHKELIELLKERLNKN